MTTARGGPRLAVLLLASACSSGPAPGPAAGPAPTVDGVTVTPSQVTLTPGEVLRFRASVTGTGSVPQGVRWTIATTPNGTPRDGWIDPDGTYHAPQVVTASQVIIRATSDTAPAVLGTATVDLPARSFAVAPRILEMPSGGTARFTSSATGVLDPAVEWTSSCGSIDPDGLFQAPVAAVTTWCSVWARCISSGDALAAEVTVLPEPSRLTGTSGPTAANEILTIHGSGFSAGDCVVQFSSASEPAQAECTEGAGEVTVRVPSGAVTGPVRVLESKGGTKLVASEAVHFDRAPRLRLRAERQDLSAGESTPLQLAFLGAGPTPVTFEADVGAVSGQRYVAPSTVGGTTFAKVRACVAGTANCTGIVLAIHPFRVVPDDPLVASGSSLALGAQRGDAPVDAVFSLGTGTGSVTARGAYAASAAIADAGPTWIDATVGATTEKVEIGVGGLVPGVVGRIHEHIDQRQGGDQGTTRWGMTADALAVAGSRLYVAAGNPEDADCPGCYPIPDGSPSYYWIDTYDISDPLHPRWLGAVESATRPEGMFAAAGNLYVWSTLDSSVAVWREEFHFLLNQGASLAVYDLAGELPALVNRHVYSPAAGSNYPVNTPPGRDADKVYEFPPLNYSIPAFTVWVRPAGEPLAPQREVHLELPPPCFSAGGFTASGSRVYAVAECTYLREYRILVYDIASETPALVGSLASPQPFGALVADGTRLVERSLDFTRLYECATGTPVFLAELPAGGETAPVVAPSGKLVVVGQDGLTGRTHGPTVIETGGPAGMIATAALYSGNHGRGVPISGGPRHAPTGAALAGDHLYSAEGRAGVGIYDVGVAGGLLPRSAVLPPSRACFWEALSAVVRQGWIYAAGTWECPSDFGSYLAAWDLSTADAGRAALVWEDYRSSLPDLMRLELGGPGFLLSSPDGVEIWSLDDPSAPQPVASVALDGRTLAVVGTVAWVGTFTGELVALDIGDPASPVVVGRLDLGASVAAIRPLDAGRLAIGLSGSATGDLALVDGAVPASPIELGRAGLGVQVLDVDVDPASALAVLATSTGMALVDVSDPGRPVPLAAEALPPASPFGLTGAGLMPLTVKLAQGLAWVGTRGLGSVYGYDVRDPSRPRLVSSNSVGSITWVDQLVVDGSRLFVAGAGGIVLTDPSQPRNVVKTYRSLGGLQQ